MNAEIADYVRARARDLLQRLEAAGGNERAVAATIDNCLAGLDRLGLPGPENRLPSSELWNVAGHLLARGWLQNRARTKPRGYAGDHELLDWIYHERVCEDPLGALFDRYFQAQAAPQAVRNRMAMMTDVLVQGVRNTASEIFRVAVVGSAVGLEIKAALDRLSEAERKRVRATLLDLDPATIEHAQTLLCPLLPPEQIVAQPANLFRLPERPRLAGPLVGADLVFCPGMFDYLEDAGAVEMLKAIYQRLAPGGRLIVFQFALHNPTRPYMEWFGNWYLIYRSQPELERLVAQSGLHDAIVSFGSERLGIDLFASLTKPAANHAAT
jgi:extracellular factor (EF) 3-hydroxypalmitic acid methyl ester biosynthesis protein